MKKLLWIAAAAMLLAGCSAENQEVFETIGEVGYQQETVIEASSLAFDLPEEAASEAMAGEDGSTVYSWDSFEVCASTLESGDLEKTLAAVTGMDANQLTVMKKDWNDMTLYQTVWCTTGEDGILLGRAVIADDGNYHYCVSITGPENVDSQPVYDQIVSSLRIGDSDSEK